MELKLRTRRLASLGTEREPVVTPPQPSILAVVTIKSLRSERGLPIFEQVWPILPILGHFRGEIEETLAKNVEASSGYPWHAK